MRTCMLKVFLLATSCAMPFLSGCSYVSVHSHQYIGMPEFPATNPADIEILHAPPSRPHDRIGEITLFPEGSPSNKKIEDTLKASAARMGANAVVVVSDTMREVGEYMTGPWWHGQINTEWSRVIVGVCIRYRQEGQKSPSPDKGETMGKATRMAFLHCPYPLGILARQLFSW